MLGIGDNILSAAIEGNRKEIKKKKKRWTLGIRERSCKSREQWGSYHFIVGGTNYPFPLGLCISPI